MVADEDDAQPSVVGIGASAGGLEALRALVAELPAQGPFAYVIVQHLSPTHQSMLVQLLARETRLDVRELEDGAAPIANVIHVTPARWNVRLEEGVFLHRHLLHFARGGDG
jgi:two-component system, chemotaxis family, CheB/CheR fusion protein